MQLGSLGDHTKKEEASCVIMKGLMPYDDIAYDAILIILQSHQSSLQLLLTIHKLLVPHMSTWCQQILEMES